ncbi:hypothetical protein QL285_070948 [Trifolium repens]|nr:hypothetical protein QL285_070948 [Trifolium repens]
MAINSENKSREKKRTQQHHQHLTPPLTETREEAPPTTTIKNAAPPTTTIKSAAPPNNHHPSQSHVGNELPPRTRTHRQTESISNLRRSTIKTDRKHHVRTPAPD